MKKYQIIYADPPWRYSGGKGKNSKAWGNSLSSYKCMKLEEICSLPISEISDKDCSLFLWTTFPMLKAGMEVLERWGFKYKTTAFVWVKKYKNNKDYCGMGYWTRSGAELCLLGIKGKPMRICPNVRQIITHIVEKHSHKPQEVRERIFQLMGGLPRIELFTRQKTEGWDVWGNEVESDIELA